MYIYILQLYHNNNNNNNGTSVSPEDRFESVKHCVAIKKIFRLK